MNTLILPKVAINNNTATITNPAQLRHLKTVLNATVGDTLKIAQLGGCLGTAKIVGWDDDGCVLGEVRLDTLPPAKLGVTVVLALPRPKVLRRLVIDMTALGVDRIVLVNSVRTDKSYWSSPLLERLDEFVLEGLQQGVDTIPPLITLSRRFKPFVQDELPDIIKTGQAVVLHPYADLSFYDSVCERGLPCVVVIGAEGGFVPYEIELLGSVGVTSATLGQRILRTESAVNAVLGRWLR